MIERRPENAFFERFANVFTYETPEQFRVALRTALASTPAPLSEEESHALSWAGGTEVRVRVRGRGRVRVRVRVRVRGSNRRSWGRSTRARPPCSCHLSSPG